jgi:anthranilate phosphoribosyltransferase
LDEVTLFGPTRAIETHGDQQREFAWTPEDFGVEIAAAGRDRLAVETPDESAALIRRVLEGEQGPAREIVILNAAAALWTVGLCNTPREGAEQAAQALDSRAAGKKLQQWIEASRS